MLPGEKIRNLRSSNCWKCMEIVNPTTTTLFLFHFKSSYDPIRRTFLALGHTAQPPPAYGPVEATLY